MEQVDLNSSYEETKSGVLRVVKNRMGGLGTRNGRTKIF